MVLNRIANRAQCARRGLSDRICQSHLILSKMAFDDEKGLAIAIEEAKKGKC